MTAPGLTPFEMGQRRGAEIAAARPLPVSLAERMALLLRPAITERRAS